jgi:hypothetical protein
MKLHQPFEISARLMPAVKVGGATISLEVSGRVSKDGRDIYSAFIDLPGGEEHEVADLRSGCQGGSVQEGMRALLSFLSAAAESYQYQQRTGREGENSDLFPVAVLDWASSCSDELSMLACEIEENDELIEDE